MSEVHRRRKNECQASILYTQKLMLAYILFWWIQMEQTNVVLCLLYENKPSYKKLMFKSVMRRRLTIPES